MRTACAVLLCLVLACHDHGSYATYQACFDEHVNVESLSVQEAIVVCCLDHPIDGTSTVCGQTALECVDYLGTNLAMGATDAEKTAACDEYIRQKGM